MENDKPIKDLSEDRLHRKTFVRALADEISSSEVKQFNVVGLYGKWGSGKTSILELLDKELKQKHYFTTYFNPWRYKSEDILLTELFLKILLGAQSDHTLSSKIDKLGKFLDEYSQYLVLPKLSVMGLDVDASKTVQGFGKGLGNLLKDKDSFDDKKEQINQVLRQLSLPLIIFIDDIDRLDVKEIQSLFKIVKLTADFDNLIYIIAFDEEIVAKSLATTYGSGAISDGKGFLEKIVQLPLRLPHVNNLERFEYTLELINKWLQINNVPASEKYKNDFLQCFKSIHDVFIQTPRDSKRLINSFSFSYRCLTNEVCLYDIILLETIRVFIPLVFSQIIFFRHELFSNSSGENGYELNNSIGEIGKSFREKISDYSSSFNVIEDAINFLFPYNSIFNIGYTTHRSEKREDLLKHQRVGIAKYFDRYIEFKIGKEDISDTEFKKILSEINEKSYDDLGDEINTLCNYPRESIFPLLVHYKDSLTITGKANVAILVCVKEHIFKDNSFNGKFINRAIQLSLELLSTLDIEIKKLVLKSIILRCEKAVHASFILHECLYGYGTMQTSKFEPESYVKELLSLHVINVQQKTINELFKEVDIEKNNILFNQIEDYGHIDVLRSKLEEYITNDPENTLLVMKSLISMTYINFSNIGVYSNDISTDFFKRIETYLKRELLVKNCHLLYPDIDKGLPDGDLEDYEFESDKKIAVQYLRYVKKLSSINRGLSLI